ncbi:MAG: hypothetical protein L0Z53_22800 [Acidobacteriales bacterium]|nr:hypothetical protein [Terriglobales bacterium]
MSQPDVRARLSAEGVQDVVNAFKKVSAEGEKLGKSGGAAGRGLGILRGQAASLASVLPTIAVGAVVTSFVAMTKSALENADALGKLSQKTGLTVETLSTLSLGARTADLDQEQLRTGLIKFTKTVDDYDQGVRSARDATKSLFGGKNALQGLSDDQRLLKVVDALAKLEPGARRTGAAIEFFGKQGAELLPLIDDLGNGGFDELRKKAQQLGLVIDKDLADAAQRANDALTDIKSAAQGMATQFASGLAPAIAEAGEALAEAVTNDGVSGFKILGDIAGKVLKGIAEFVLVVAAGITQVFGRVFNFIERSGELAANVLRGNFKAGFNQFVIDLKRDADALDKTIQDKAARVMLALDGENRKQRRKPGDTSASENTAEADRQAKARRDLLSQLAENELNLVKAKNKLAEAEEKRRFEAGLVNLEQFFNDRRAIINQETDKEIAILRGKLEFERSRPLGQGESETDRRKNLAEIQGKIDVAEIGRTQELADLEAERIKAIRESQKEQLQFEAQMLEAQGQRFAAARKELEAQAADLKRFAGEGDADFQARSAAFKQAGEAIISFDEAKAKAQQAMAELALARQAIETQVRAGTLFELQGEQQIQAIEQERLPLMQQLAEALERAAEATGDPEKIQQAREFNQALVDMAVSSDSAGLSMANFKKQAADAITADLTNFFATGIQEAESFGDAMRGLALSVVESLRQIVTQMLINIAVQALMKSLGMSQGGQAEGGTGGGILSFFGKHATGGLIRGPGSSISDSIPAWLSNQEFVVRASVVRQPGMLDFLETINSGGLGTVRRRSRGFADGGLVEAAPGAPGVGGASSLLVGLDEGLLLKRFEGNSKFDRLIVKVLERNERRANKALGNGSGYRVRA